MSFEIEKVANTKAVVMKSGAVGVACENRAEFRKAMGLTSAEAKRRWPQYLLDTGRTLNGKVTTGMTEGKIITTKLVTNKEKGTWYASGLLASHKKLVLPAPKAPKSEAPQINIEGVMAALKAAGLGDEAIAALLKA